MGVPEDGGRKLISQDPLAPGSVYAATMATTGRVGLYRIEVSIAWGTGKLKISGAATTEMKESMKSAFDFLKAEKLPLGIAAQVDTTDFHVPLVDLLNWKVGADLGVGFFIGIYSALQRHPTLPGLVAMDDMAIHGNPKPVHSLVEPLQLIMDNGGKRALIPIENKRQFLEVDAEVMEQVAPIFYSDPVVAARKGLGLS